MQRLIFSLTLLLGMVYSVTAQEIADHAIGLRIGGNDGFSNELSYQKGIGDNNRLEVDLGFRSNKNFNVWKLSGIYQWLWNIDGGFNWYAGVGAGVGNWNYRLDDNLYNDSAIFLNADGNIGIEYNFDFPLLISLDFRPEIGLVNDFGSNDLDLDIALGVRYQF